MVSTNFGSAANDFYVYIYDEEEYQKQQRFTKGYRMKNIVTNRKIGFWCFSAGLAMKQLAELGPRSILLTSGTLSPMESFQAELGIEFNQKLENPHVIDHKQVSV